MLGNTHTGGVELLRFLVTVKTYPNPSKRYRETVCTAGITADGEWIRLYPVPFRYWEVQQQYNLYDWVELNARKRARDRDKRKENYQPAGLPKVLRNVGTDHNWRERRRIVLPHRAPSLEALVNAYSTDGTSLGIIKPRVVHGVHVEPDESDWNPLQRRYQEQQVLFGPQPRKLEKPRHRFYYEFSCDDPSSPRHRMIILDWGLYELYRKIKSRECQARAAEKVEAKCWELVAEDKEAYFFVGKHYRFPSFMIIGMFAPKKEPPDERIQLSFD